MNEKQSQNFLHFSQASYIKNARCIKASNQFYTFCKHPKAELYLLLLTDKNPRYALSREASNTTHISIKRRFQNLQDVPEELTSRWLRKKVEILCDYAHREIHRCCLEGESACSMGMLLIDPQQQQLGFVGVGDISISLYSQKHRSFRFLNQVNTCFQPVWDAEKIIYVEDFPLMQLNVSRSLGQLSSVHVKPHLIDYQIGDQFVLYSKGIHDHEISAFMKRDIQRNPDSIEEFAKRQSEETSRIASILIVRASQPSHTLDLHNQRSLQSECQSKPYA